MCRRRGRAAPESPRPASPIVQVVVKPSQETRHVGYVLQLASFHRREDAERLKALLIMHGIDVQIHAILQQNVSWYRVVAGPFTSREEALQMQALVGRKQRIVGIVRKMMLRVSKV